MKVEIPNYTVGQVNDVNHTVTGNDINVSTDINIPTPVPDISLSVLDTAKYNLLVGIQMIDVNSSKDKNDSRVFKA